MGRVARWLHVGVWISHESVSACASRLKRINWIVWFDLGLKTMAVEATSNATTLQTDYLSLLVTQLQNQDPMAPMDSSEMTAQLSQLYQLQALENMDSNFSQVLESAQQSYASSLVGKEVSFEASGDDGSAETVTGQVQEVNIEDPSDVTLMVGNRTIGLADVISVRN